MKRKWVAALMVLCLLAAKASAEEYVSIQQLQRTAPQEREGVSILLPDTDVLPALDVCYRSWQLPVLPEKMQNYTPNDPRTVILDQGYQNWLPKTNIMAGQGAGTEPWPAISAEKNPFSCYQARRFLTELLRNLLGLEEGQDYVLTDLKATSRYYLYKENQTGPIKPISDMGQYEVNVGAVCQVLHGQVLNNCTECIVFQRQESYAPHIPNPYMAAAIVNPDCFTVSIVDWVQEADCLAEDIPLLNWDAIDRAIADFQQTGRVIQLNQIELCPLVLLNTPELSAAYFRAMPCWKLTGSFSGPAEDSGSTAVVYLNAQSGKVIDPWNPAKDRGCANPLMQWKDVKPDVTF